MIAAAMRLVALPVEGESPTAIETRRARELLHTAVAQQAAYSYSHERIHSTPRPSQSYSRHIDSPAVSSSEQRCNQPCGHDPARDGANAQTLVDQGRARREAELAAQQAAHPYSPVYPSASMEEGMTSRTLGVPCLVSALCNERLPKDFKGPRKVPNYTADQPPKGWVESYEMVMELLDVGDAACAKYFTMMLDGTARTWLIGLPANSIGSGAELKARFIQNSKDTCKQPISIVDLDFCIQEEGESTTHWVRRVSTILQSSDRINTGLALLMLEKNCHFVPLQQKLGRLKCHCSDMGELMAALVKYADSSGTKDPKSDDEKPGKGKKSGNTKGQHHNPAN